MLEHGGRLLCAARRYGIEVERWLDLSTGINPQGWPVPAIPPRAWLRLPDGDGDDDLVEQACAYYSAPALLPVAGSQAAIQALPALRARARVGVLAPGYAEHAHGWRRCAHAVEERSAEDLLANVGRYDVLVLSHPNNPGGETFTTDALLRVHAALAARGGWLLVDEAFIDTDPTASLCPFSARDGLIVLRSVGKFFGLAGARVGFVCAAPTLLTALRERLGPWPLTGPSRYIVARALADREWQASMRARLPQRSRQLAQVLSAHGLRPDAGCALFQYCRVERAESIHAALAERAILTRLFAQPAGLRFGLPPCDADFARLAQALAKVMA